MANKIMIVSSQAIQASNNSIIIRETRKTRGLLIRFLMANGFRVSRRKTPVNTTENPTARASGEQSAPVEEQTERDDE